MPSPLQLAERAEALYRELGPLDATVLRDALSALLDARGFRYNLDSHGQRPTGDVNR